LKATDRMRSTSKPYRSDDRLSLDELALARGATSRQFLLGRMI
jgi:hypothetical protein